MRDHFAHARKVIAGWPKWKRDLKIFKEGEAMSRTDLRRKPHKISGTNKIWWYEAPTGIEIVTSYGGPNCEIRTIPWRLIRNALKRKEKP